MRASLSDKLSFSYHYLPTGSRGGLSIVEQRVEVSDGRSSRSWRGRIPILYRDADLLDVGIVGCIDIHGITVVLCRKVKPVPSGKETRQTIWEESVVSRVCSGREGAIHSNGRAARWSFFPEVVPVPELIEEGG